MRQCSGCGRTFFLPAPAIDGKVILKWMMIIATVLLVMYQLLLGCMLTLLYDPQDPEKLGAAMLLPIGVCLSVTFYAMVMLLLGGLYYYMVRQDQTQTAEEQSR